MERSPSRSTARSCDTWDDHADGEPPSRGGSGILLRPALLAVDRRGQFGEHRPTARARAGRVQGACRARLVRCGHAARCARRCGRSVLCAGLDCQPADAKDPWTSWPWPLRAGSGLNGLGGWAPYAPPTWRAYDIETAASEHGGDPSRCHCHAARWSNGRAGDVLPCLFVPQDFDSESQETRLDWRRA